MRYGHPSEVVFEIEENQCGSCQFKIYHGSDGDHDFLMCPEIESSFILDGEWHEDVDQDEFGQAYCLRYRDKTLAEESAPEQERLF